MWDNSHSLCVSFSLTTYGFKIILDYSFQQNSGLYPWDILQGLAGMLQFCRQDKNCVDTAKKIINSLKTILQAALASPEVFQWEHRSLAPLKHTPKNGCTYRRYVNLAITCFSGHKSSVPLCDFGNTGGWSASPPECCCWAQQHCRTQSAVQAPVQSPQGWSSHPYPQLEALAQPVPNGMLDQHTQNGLRPNSWCWRNETDSSWVSHTCKMILKGALEKPHLNRGRKVSPWSCSAAFYCCRRCWQPPSLRDLSKVVELKVYLGRGSNTQGSCSDMAPQCAFRWPKGPLDPSASTMATDTVSHWSLCLVPAAWKHFRTATPQKSSPAAVGFEHEGEWKETGCFTLSHTCRVCRGKALFQGGQTWVLSSVYQGGDLQGW